MRSDTPAPVEPEFTPGLIAWLEYTFPVLVANPKTAPEELYYNGGQQSVVDLIKARAALQDIDRQELANAI